jgi:hypothetical protein
MCASTICDTRAFKAQCERLTNLTVVFSHAVPVLSRVLANPAIAASVALKPADNFPHDKADGSLLLAWAKDYSDDLARLIVLSTFSYFEAFVRDALGEVFALQGGVDAFRKLAERRVKRQLDARRDEPPRDLP